MAVVSMKQLLEAGVHFGHQTRRWNPKMAPYIYTERNGIYIIDLQKTVKKLEEAYNFVRDLAANGQSILFVGTKKQAQDAIKEEAERVGQYYVNARWLGGMLTNFKTMRTRIDRLAQLKKMEEDGTFNLPGIVYHVKNGSMDVFAFKGKRPVETTPLFRAPFFNVTGSSVCLGSSSLEKPQNPTFLSLLEYWEKRFWLTEFSHLGGNVNPTVSNLVIVTENIRNNPFDMNELKPMNKKLKDILP